MNQDLLAEKRIRAAFHSISGIGSIKIRQLISIFGNATEAWNNLKYHKKGYYKENWLNTIAERIKGLDPFLIEEQLDKKGIKTVIPEEEEYPFLLREISDPPPILYYKGRLHGAKEALAIVGSRKATPYGRAAAETISKEMAQSGIIVVSGLARGIDTASHKGALKGNGITYAVLGSGLDYIYPNENQKLADEIIENGALISEFTPGTSPKPQLFPIRNRLISGISRGVVVVEAALKSGALITTDFALEQGREVFAVPGPIFNDQSKGTNNLIRQGAKLVENLSDIVSEIPTLNKLANDEHKTKQLVKTKGKKVVEPGQQELLNLLSDIPIHIDDLTQKAGTLAEQVPLILLELQLAGMIEQLPGQYYVLSHKF